MLFLLDTNIVSALMTSDPAVDACLAAISPGDEAAICTIVLGEALFGVGRLPAGKRRDTLGSVLSKILSGLQCYPVPAEAASHYSRVKIECRNKGVALDENDFWIAAIAAALGATLVSRDTDFSRIDGLAVASWS